MKKVHEHQKGGYNQLLSHYITVPVQVANREPDEHYHHNPKPYYPLPGHPLPVQRTCQHKHHTFFTPTPPLHHPQGVQVPNETHFHNHFQAKL